MNIRLIKATTNDAEAMQKMQIESFTPHFLRYKDDATSPVNESLEKMLYRINYEKGYYFKIMVDNIHAGCLWVYEKEPKLYRIGIMYISPEYQCKGVGQKALAIAESLFPEAEAWELDCPTDMSINRNCYEKVGYRLTGEAKIINDELTLMFYRKNIVPLNFVVRDRGYKIVTLCGSIRFKDDFVKVQNESTLQGNLVISIEFFETELSDEIKSMLDDMHKTKIDMAHEIYVINKDGYIGRSTRNEINYAIKTGKTVKYLESINS